MVSLKGIRMEDKRIKAVKQLPESQLVWDVQVFFVFANFYWRFIQGFSRITALLTSMLKTLERIESAIQPEEGIIRAGGNSKAGHDRSKRNESELDSDEVDGVKVEDDKVGKKVQKTSRSKNLSKSKKTVESSNFFIPRANLAFIKLRQVFFKAPILYHFDLEYYILIETDESGYAIGGVLSQLILDDLGQ